MTQLKTQTTQLETWYLKFSSFEDRGSSRVIQVLSDWYCNISTKDKILLIKYVDVQILCYSATQM